MLLIGHGAHAEDSPGKEQRLFYRVSIGGSPAGKLIAEESRRDDLLTTSFALELQFQRAGQGQSLGMESRFVEKADGTPVEAWSRQRLGSTPIETTYRFMAETIEVESRQGDNVVRRSLPKADGWQPPAAADAATVKAMAAALAGGPTVFKITSVDPLFGPQPMTTTWELEAAAEELELDGRRFLTSRWRQTQDLAPQVPSILWLDRDGEIRRSHSEMAGLDMLIEWSAEEPRLADFAAGARPAGGARPAAGAATPGPEVMLKTLVRADRPLAAPRSLRRAVYELRGDNLALPDLGYQRVEKTSTGLRVVVDLAAPLEEALSPEARATYLEASIFLNHHNAKVRELHQRALAATPAAPAAKTPAAVAERLRSFVGNYLETKDLRSVLATASEVAENASGDCTEHAVLLAALLRAEGIPARVVFGLIYVDRFAGENEVFGYHMWTQAYLDGRFVDLDATLARPFDAAHISVGASGLDEVQTAQVMMNNAMQTLSKASLHLIEPAR